MSKPPNIIIITTHDSGCHFGCYGAEGVKTPNIDSLASSGVMFSNMFSPSSICTPSRGALLTGQWPERNGLYGLSGSKWRYELKDFQTHLSSVAGKDRYRTALFGFQHEAIDDADLGFDTICPLSHDGRNRTAVEISEEASRFLRDSGNAPEPFYLQIGFHETHTPYIWGGNEADDRYGTWTPKFTGYPDDDSKLNAHIAELQASVHRVDEAVGVITRALDETGLAENTLLLFNTDHGVELPRAKWTMLDPGCHVAFILRWPGGGLNKGTVVDSFLGNLDFLPTLSEIAGLHIDHDLDGMSFAPILNGESQAGRNEMYHTFAYGSNAAARTNRFKYIRNFNGTMFNAYRFHEGQRVPLTMLFDLENDPLEFKNVVDDEAYRDIVTTLDDKLWTHLESVDSPLLRGHVYHPPVRELFDEYNARRATWADQDNPSFSLKHEGSVRYTGELHGMRLVVDFNGGTRSQAIGCFCIPNDPECTTDILDDADWVEKSETLRTCLWARLEKNREAVLSGIEPSESHAQCLRAYNAWRANR
jgi:N-sulfoglucosamine sulfohydrolase